RERRNQVLKAHLLTQGSQAMLQARVNEHLGVENINNPVKSAGAVVGTGLIDELIELDPYDTRHLFWEELRRIAFALREITPEDVDDKTLGEFLSASDQLSRVLGKIQKRRRQREGRRPVKTSS